MKSSKSTENQNQKNKRLFLLFFDFNLLIYSVGFLETITSHLIFLQCFCYFSDSASLADEDDEHEHALIHYRSSQLKKMKSFLNYYFLALGFAVLKKIPGLLKLTQNYVCNGP